MSQQLIAHWHAGGVAPSCTGPSQAQRGIGFRHAHVASTCQVLDDEGKIVPVRLLGRVDRPVNCLTVELTATGDLVFEGGGRACIQVVNVDESRDTIRIAFATALRGDGGHKGAIEVKITEVDPKDGLPPGLLKTPAVSGEIEVMPGRWPGRCMCDKPCDASRGRLSP